MANNHSGGVDLRLESDAAAMTAAIDLHGLFLSTSLPGRKWPAKATDRGGCASPSSAARCGPGKRRGSLHEIRRIDVLHRLFDGRGRARGRAGAARLRHRLGTRAFAYSAVAQVGLHHGGASCPSATTTSW